MIQAFNYHLKVGFVDSNGHIYDVPPQHPLQNKCAPSLPLRLHIFFKSILVDLKMVGHLLCHRISSIPITPFCFALFCAYLHQLLLIRRNVCVLLCCNNWSTIAKLFEKCLAMYDINQAMYCFVNLLFASNKTRKFS